MKDETVLLELSLRPDFAARVLDKADAIARRRQKWQGAGIATTAIGLVGIGVWSMQPWRPLQPAAPVTQIANANELSDIDQPENPDPLEWMFPDAAPLAQFADQYSDATMGGAEQRQRMLFADETDGARRR